MYDHSRLNHTSFDSTPSYSYPSSASYYINDVPTYQMPYYGAEQVQREEPRPLSFPFGNNWFMMHSLRNSRSVSSPSLTTSKIESKRKRNSFHTGYTMNLPSQTNYSMPFVLTHRSSSQHSLSSTLSTPVEADYQAMYSPEETISEIAAIIKRNRHSVGHTSLSHRDQEDAAEQDNEEFIKEKNELELLLYTIYDNLLSENRLQEKIKEKLSNEFKLVSERKNGIRSLSIRHALEKIAHLNRKIV